jgi:hypothetical protein
MLDVSIDLWHALSPSSLRRIREISRSLGVHKDDVPELIKYDGLAVGVQFLPSSRLYVYIYNYIYTLHVVLTFVHSNVGFMIKTAQKHLWLRCPWAKQRSDQFSFQAGQSALIFSSDCVSHHCWPTNPTAYRFDPQISSQHVDSGSVHLFLIIALLPPSQAYVGLCQSLCTVYPSVYTKNLIQKWL